MGYTRSQYKVHKMSDNVSEFSERTVDFEFSSDIMTERGTIQTYFIPKGTNFKGF